jgi:hypothetical protein
MKQVNLSLVKIKVIKESNQILGYCKVAHEQARDSYILWCDGGKNKQGLLFETMKKTRAYFMSVLRKCKSADCHKAADMLAHKLLLNDDKHFWNEIKRTFFLIVGDPPQNAIPV